MYLTEPQRITIALNSCSPRLPCPQELTLDPECPSYFLVPPRSIFTVLAHLGVSQHTKLVFFIFLNPMAVEEEAVPCCVLSFL